MGYLVWDQIHGKMDAADSGETFWVKSWIEEPKKGHKEQNKPHWSGTGAGWQLHRSRADSNIQHLHGQSWKSG